MIECPCRYCNKRHSECHSQCNEYKEWSEYNNKLNAKIREAKTLDYLARDSRPKRRHGRK